ncbi:S53 family peptidase [Chromobacterium haemolyticum]|nr:S53 family peptidase [Chromobacterium haemolyticum]
MFAKQYTAALVSAAFFSIAAQATTLNWQSTNTLAHPVQSLIPQAQDSGEVAAGQSVHIAVALKVRNKAQLDTLTQSILQGGSKHYLSKTEFLDRFSPTEAQAQTVVKHLQANGFRNIKVAPNRLLITADGSAATVKAGFQTSLHRYNINGRQAFANVANAQVPSQLADIVLAVHGLQNVHQFHTALRHPTPQAFKTASVSGHSPTDFPSIYNANSLPPASNTTVGIIAEGDLTQTLSDLQDFASSAGYGTVATSVINSGTPTSDTSGTEEWNLDSQDILAAAGGAVQQMNFYVAPSMTNADITAAFNAAVSDGTAKVINVSLGECETSAQSDGMTASADQIFQAAVAQGQTFSVSTGDSGSYECGGRTARQSYPAVSPYVIAVGGTTLSTSGKTGYLSETTWNGGGGGPSYTESAPAWQTSAGRRADHFQNQARRARRLLRRRPQQRRAGAGQRQHLADRRHQPGGAAVHRLLGADRIGQRQQHPLAGAVDLQILQGQPLAVPRRHQRQQRRLQRRQGLGLHHRLGQLEHRQPERLHRQDPWVLSATLSRLEPRSAGAFLRLAPSPAKMSPLRAGNQT